MLSIGAQGLWLRIMFLMHDSPRYGYLCTRDGSPIPSAYVARECGLSLEQYETLLSELDSVSVPSRTAAGVIFSRRMVRDRIKRAMDSKRQKKHRDTACHAVVTTTSQVSSVSSSLSSSKLKPKTTPAASPPLPDWLPADAWKGYCEMRVKMRRPMTDRATKLALMKLATLMAAGHNPTAVLEQSIFNSWQGLFVVRGAGDDGDIAAKVNRAFAKISNGVGGPVRARHQAGGD